MRRFLSIAMVLVMILLLTACGPAEKDQLLGTWKTEMDLTELFNESMVATADEELREILQVRKFNLTVSLSFYDDDTYVMTVDEEALNATMMAAREDLQAGLEVYLMETVAAAVGFEISLEDILAAAGTSMEELMDDIITPELVEDIVSGINSDGKFKAEDGKLYLSAGRMYEVDVNEYETYTVEGNTLTLHAYVPADEVDDFTKGMYPMVFHKIS